jgi:hypothetical protein
VWRDETGDLAAGEPVDLIARNERPPTPALRAEPDNANDPAKDLSAESCFRQTEDASGRRDRVEPLPMLRLM